VKAIQFVGTQRSGSNLLRVMLHEHSRISSPHPPHILQVMMPFLPMYGDLKIETNFRKLMEDVCVLVERNPVNWNICFDRADVFKRTNNASLPQVMKALYEIKANAKGADHWCCKSMASVHYVNEMNAAEIHPFYIFIYRDGRDVALSFRKAIVGEKHFYHLAKQWKQEQDLSLALCKQLGEKRSIMIRYEEFILDPESVAREICKRLGIEYDSRMMDYASSEESKETASSGVMWSNLTKPVMKTNTQKFRKEMSADDILIFESVAGDTLRALNYQTDFSSDQWLDFSANETSQFDFVNSEMKKQARAAALENDIEKRKAQDEFISSLKERFENYAHVSN
jgi:Sulfotransferase family